MFEPYTRASGLRSDMKDSQVVELPQICRSFPEMSKSEVCRDNLVDTISLWLEDEIELVLIDGDPNIGKTTLLSQFARKYPKQTFSLFLRPASRWSCDPEILRYDLANQLEWVLSGKELSQDVLIDAGELRKRFLRLQSKARMQSTRYYFVLDGLTAIPKDETQTRKAILGLLPLGLTPFRFLISGESSALSEIRLSEIRHRSFSIPVFGIPDTTKYLADLVRTDEQREQLHRIAKGIPGRLASIRRLLKGGTTVESLLASVPNRLPEFFELEWAPVDLSVVEENRMLSILCHDEREHTTDELAEMAETTRERINSILAKLPFLQTDSGTGVVGFVHQSFRDFAAQKLSSTKSVTIDNLISKASAVPDDPKSMAQLPRLYRERSRFSELVDYMSADRIALIASQAPTWSPLLVQAKLALDAASEIRKFDSVLRFSLNSATIQDIDTAGPIRSEIEANLALGENETALGLATRPTLREDRLQLLILIARAKRKEGLSPAPELLDNIRSLFKDLDIVSTDKALAMAADLVKVAPDLAVKLLQKVEKSVDGSKTAEWKEGGNNDGQGESGQGTSVVGNIRASVRPSIVKQMTAEIAAGMRETAAEQLIRGAENIVESQDRLLLYRQWILQNRMRPDALSVTQKALDLIVRVPELSANAGTACEIAASLPFAKDLPALKLVIAQLDAQSGIFRRLGPSEDYVTYQLLLAEAQSGFDLQASSSRVMEVYFFVCDVKDISIRTNCLAQLVAALPRIDKDGRLAKREELPQIIQKEFESATDLLLSATGDHGAIFSNITRVLAYNDAAKGLQLAKRLNTVGRRDSAIEAAIRGVLSRDSKNISVADLIFLVSEIKENSALGKALILVFEQLNSMKASEIGAADKLPVIVALCNNIRDAENRIRAQANALILLTNLDIKPVTLREVLIKNIHIGWDAINTSWRKSYSGFSLVQLLAKPYPAIAREFLKKTHDHANSVVSSSAVATWDLVHTVLLANRAFRGLLERKVDSPDDIRNLNGLIERIPSLAQQANAFSDLALRLYRGGRAEEGNAIVLQKLKPLVASLSSDDKAYRDDVISECAAALYIAHQATALEMISTLPPSSRDHALLSICVFLEYRVGPNEAIEGPPQRFISYEEIIDVCNLIDKMTEDALIYAHISKIAECVGKFRTKYTRPHTAEIKRKLSEIIERKLPASDYITHEGFKICAQVALSSVEPYSNAGWGALIARAELIPNTADRCFVLAVIGAALPARESAFLDSVVNKFFEGVPKIPAVSEQIRLYDWAATQLVDSNRALAQRCIREAITLFAKSEEKDRSLLRNLVDMARQIGEEFAEEVATLCEADPAKATARQAGDRLKLIEQCKGLTDESKKRQPTDMQTLRQAAWKALGELNTKRAAPVPLGHILSFVKDASEAPLSDSYPIYAWAIENAVARLGQTDQAETTLRPVFQACMVSARLTYQLIVPNASGGSIPQVREEKNSVVISEGDQEKGLQYICKWVSDSKPEWLVICDVYFGLGELNVIRLIRQAGLSGKITVLTSRKHQGKVDLPWDESYRVAWQRLTSSDPGHCDIIIVGGKNSGELPVHARWMLSSSTGLGIDASLNGLGVGKSTEIRILTLEETANRLTELQYLIERVPAIRDGERLEYSVISL